MEVKTKIKKINPHTLEEVVGIKTNISKTIIGFVLAILVLAFFNIQSLLAASLGISPSSGSYGVGTAFSVTVYVASSDQAMNAVSGTVSFPSDKLTVTAVSSSGSVVDFWVQEPSYSNSTGIINFEGVVMTPGFTGSYAKILVISFKTKSVGSALLNFSSGSVLANDGLGTNILSGLGSARFEIDVPVDGPAAPDAETPAVRGGTPQAPLITSITHPNSDSWYNISDAEFSWDLANNISAARLLVDEEAKVSPSVSYVPAISNKKITALEDGTWYFHVRLRNSYGWGDITHFRFQIDTQNPEYFNISQVEIDDATNPRVKFNFDSSDSMSGISHYEIRFEGGEIEEWIDDGDHIYETPILEPGNHRLIVKAIDRAGNFLTNFVEFNVKALDAPEITECPKKLESKETLILKGKTYPNSELTIYLQKNKGDIKNYIVLSDEYGKFKFINEDRLYDGVYKLWTSVIDSRGAQSGNSNAIKIIVEQPRLLRIGAIAIDVLAVLIPLIALVFLLIFMCFRMVCKIRTLRARVRKETKDVEKVLHKEILSIRGKLKNHLDLFEKVKKKRKLTKEEQKIVPDLKKSLSRIEKKVGKEIDDIKKQVK